MSAQRAAQLVEAGLWLQMSGDVEGARRLFEQALKLDPANGRAKELLETMQASVRAAPEATVSPLPELARIATPPRVPAVVDPFRAPEAPERSNLFDLDWSKATGLERAPTPQEPELAAEPKPEPISDASSRSVPPGMKPADPLRWESLSEPMPPPEDVDIPIELPSPVEEPPGKPVVRPVRFAPNATSAWDSQSNPGVHLQDVNRAMGDAMDLVDDSPAAARAPEPESPAQEAPAQDGVRQEVETLLQGAKDLLELDDHSGAMELIVKAQQLAPNDPDVQAMRERSEKTLQTMFESKLGEMTSRPRVVLKDDEIIWLNLDHRAGFVLAQIDGMVSFEDLFEVCGMSRLDTARILAQLIEEGVITA